MNISLFIDVSTVHIFSNILLHIMYGWVFMSYVSLYMSIGMRRLGMKNNKNVLQLYA